MLRARDFRYEAWDKLGGKWGTAALITLVYLAITGACASLSATGIGTIAILLVEGPLYIGYIIVSLSIVRNQNTKVEYLFKGFSNFGNSFLLYLLNNIFIFLWSLLLIVPGIIKALSYQMSYYILADNPEMSASDARKESMRIMEGNKWRLFCLNLSFIGWYILCGLTLGILTFWVTPYVQSAQAAFYESIRYKGEAPVAEEVKEEVKEIPEETV